MLNLIEVYPERIETLAIANLKISEEVEQLRAINAIEYDATSFNVATAVDERGKPTFPNETQRALAVKIQIAASDEYQARAAIITGLEHTQRLNIFRLERLRSELSILKLRERRQDDES